MLYIREESNPIHLDEIFAKNNLKDFVANCIIQNIMVFRL